MRLPFEAFSSKESNDGVSGRFCNFLQLDYFSKLLSIKDSVYQRPNSLLLAKNAIQENKVNSSCV